MEIAMFDDFEDAVHMHFPGYISKPVDQIDLSTGEVIATYPSMAEAARTVGSHKESIQAVASHRRGCVSAAGYGWRYHSE